MKKSLAQPNLTRVYKKLLDHDQELAAIRREIVHKNQFEQSIQSLDKILQIVTRLDQERVFTSEWIRRIERDVERLKRRLQVV